jgi:hypothetical protein
MNIPYSGVNSLARVQTIPAPLSIPSHAGWFLIHILLTRTLTLTLSLLPIFTCLPNLVV